MASEADMNAEVERENNENDEISVPNYECREFSDIAGCFSQMHRSIFGKISQIEKRTKVLEDKTESLNFTLQNQNDIIKDITETRLVNIDDKIQDVERNLLSLEVWGRKWNLVIRGIRGTANESPTVTEDKVRNFFSHDLNLDTRNMIFAAVHRLPNVTVPQPGTLRENTTPNILVRFVNIHDREAVMQAVMSELTQGNGFSVVPDLPPQINKIRQNLLMRRKSMSAEEKKKWKLVYMKTYPFVTLKLKKTRENDTPR